MKDAVSLAQHHSADTLCSAHGFSDSHGLPNRASQGGHFQDLATRKLCMPRGRDEFCEVEIPQILVVAHHGRVPPHDDICEQFSSERWTGASRINRPLRILKGLGASEEGCPAWQESKSL
jgi:hypothetical protein